MRWLLVAVMACGRIGFAPAHDTAPDGPPPCDIHQIAAGKDFTCAIDGGGGAWCWGSNTFAKIAAPASPYVLSASPIALPRAAVEISTGKESACARLDDGSVWCWGDNSTGALGDGTTAGSGPVQVALGGETALDVHVGTHQACARRASDHAVVCWGG